MQHTDKVGILPGEQMKFAKDTKRNNHHKLYRERQYPILRLEESQRGVRILSFQAKIKAPTQGLVLHFWRRKRDSNPRGFGPNGFQDRLVVTASIFLLIYGVVYYTIYKQSYFEVARETRFTNPLRIPHAAVSSSLVNGKCGYPRQRRDIPADAFLLIIYLVVTARETCFTNPLRIPHAAVSSSLVSGKCGYLRQSRNIPITMQNCAITY